MSEHAVSQPINMARPVNPRSYNGVDQHGVLSPRSTDGVGMSVAEFVLGSSPGVDIEAQINKMKARMVSVHNSCSGIGAGGGVTASHFFLGSLESLLRKKVELKFEL